MLRLVEEFNWPLLKLRHHCLESPDVDLTALHHRLKGFAAMPDVDSPNIFVFMGGDLPSILDGDLDTGRLQAEMEQRERLRTDAPHLFEMERFAINLHADLETVDSDAYDLAFADEQGIQPRDETAQSYLSSAIFHGSLDIMRCLVHRYRVSPNGGWEGITHINFSVLFQRQPIVEFFLKCDAELPAARDDKDPALHLVSRHDKQDLVRILCEYLKSRNQLASILESSTSEGGLAGWPVAYAAMICRAWENLALLLNYGADTNAECAEDGQRLIDLAVRPTSLEAPISILQLPLQKGVQAAYTPEYSNSPLMWAVRSSNALAVFYLALHDALISDSAVRDAEEKEEEMRAGNAVPVFDEDEHESADGWRNTSEATVLVATILCNAHQKPDGWERDLEAVFKEASQGYRGKMWIANTEPPEYLIEVRMPRMNVQDI